ncbi:MAG: MASE3 domain-containing protein [Bacillota bacterium]
MIPNKAVENRWFAVRIAVIAVIFIILNAVAGNFYFIVNANIYPTVHSTLEFISIIIAMSVSLMSWYEFRYRGEAGALVLSAVFCAVGILDLAHTLSYFGMPDFISPNSVNKASTFWIMARLFQSVGILAAFYAGQRLLKGKKAGIILVFTAGATAVFVYYTAILIEWFPPMYDMVNRAQTPLKIDLEYIVMALLGFGVALIFKKKEKKKSDLYLSSALLVGIMSELAFTFYANAYDAYNLLGHVYKIISFSFILKALVDEGLAEIYQANHELAKKSDELAEMNRELRKADKIKNDFLANTNHELRTPLSAIVAFTELLLDEENTGRLNDIQKDYLKEINDSGRDLMKKIKGLLELSGTLGGKIVIHQERVNVREIVTDAVSELEKAFSEKGVKIDWTPGKSIYIFADREKLIRILLNLLDNALKFTGPGGLVSITAAADTVNRKVRISVNDNGVGIDPNYIDSVFNMFYQVDGTSTRKYGGTGIGLTLSMKFAEMHGGKIEVESECGKGSRFTVVLPLPVPEEVQ